MVVADEALKRLDMQRESTRVIVQGFGNVGSNAAKLMHEKGYKIIGIAEYDGGLYNTDGIDINALLEHRGRATARSLASRAPSRRSAGTFRRGLRRSCSGSDRKRHHQPQCRQDQGAHSVRRRQRPDHAVADEILAEKKDLRHPRYPCQRGRRHRVSYFEWVQDRLGYFWKEAMVNERLDRHHADSFDDVVAYAQKHGVNNRIAAYMLAIDRVQAVIRQRGIYA